VLTEPHPHEDLGQLIDRGLTASEAAEQLGITRDAAIGRAYRAGWSFGQSRPGSEEAERRRADRGYGPAPTPRTLPAELPEPTTISELAERLLSEFRIVQQALPPMVERVLNDEAFYRQAIIALVEGQCRRELDMAMATRYQAEKRKTGGGPVAKARASNLAGHAEAVAASLMEDTRLPNGKKLGDATRADLRTALAAYQAQAADARIKAGWLQAVLQSVPEGKTVRQSLTDERLQELRDLARKDAQ
jgi:hypothetical protein